MKPLSCVVLSMVISVALAIPRRLPPRQAMTLMFTSLNDSKRSGWSSQAR